VSLSILRRRKSLPKASAVAVGGEMGDEVENVIWTGEKDTRLPRL
jgi:hypothetical protein